MGHSGRGLLVCQNFQNYKTLGLETKKTHVDVEKKQNTYWVTKKEVGWHIKIFQNLKHLGQMLKKTGCSMKK